MLFGLQSLIKQEDLLSTLGKYSYAALTGKMGAPWFLVTLFVSESLLILLLSKLRAFKKRTCAVICAGIILGVVALTVFCNFVFKAISLSEASFLIRDPIIMLFRIAPAFLFIFLGYLFGLFITKYHLLDSDRTKMTALADVVLAAFLMVQLLSGNRIDLFYFTFDSVIVSVFTGISGSISLLLFSMLLPRNVKVLSETGKESLHIMVMHHSPFPILYIPIVICERYSVPVRPFICVIICVVVMVMIYYVSKFIIEPVTKKLTDMYENLHKQRKNA